MPAFTTIQQYKTVWEVFGQLLGYVGALRETVTLNPTYTVPGYRAQCGRARAWVWERVPWSAVLDSALPAAKDLRTNRR